LVLSVTAMLVAIGVTAVMAGRIQVQAASLDEDQAQARVMAQSAIELLRKAINDQPTWRTTYTSGTWNGPNDMGAGQVRFKVVDEGDGNLADDANDPVRLYAEATVGGAVRIYSAVLSCSDTVLDIPIASGGSDAEESTLLGLMDLLDNDLELGSGSQAIGLRFTSVGVPNSAVVTSAYLQFTARNGDSSATSLVIRAHASDNASSILALNYNLSGRSTTTASATWTPAAWVAGDAGNDQQSPSLTALVQEITTRTGWASGNAMAFLITGAGQRTPWSYNGSAADAPVFHVEFVGYGPLVVDTTTLRRELAD